MPARPVHRYRTESSLVAALKAWCAREYEKIFGVSWDQRPLLSLEKDHQRRRADADVVRVMLDLAGAISGALELSDRLTATEDASPRSFAVRHVVRHVTRHRDALEALLGAVGWPILLRSTEGVHDLQRLLERIESSLLIPERPNRRMRLPATGPYDIEHLEPYYLPYAPPTHREVAIIYVLSHTEGAPINFRVLNDEQVGVTVGQAFDSVVRQVKKARQRREAKGKAEPPRATQRGVQTKKV